VSLRDAGVAWRFGLVAEDFGDDRMHRRIARIWAGRMCTYGCPAGLAGEPTRFERMF